MSLFLRKIPSQCRASLNARPSYAAASSSVGRQNHPQFRYFSSNYDYDDGESSRRKIALVLGSSGCLGRTVTRYLANQLDMQVLGADIVDLPDDTDTSLDAFISIPAWNQRPSLGDVTAALVQGVSDNLADGEELDAIIIASGGWLGDPPLPKPDLSLEEFIRGAKEYGENIDKLTQMNLYPVLAANYAANRFMAEEGKRKGDRVL
jgi:NAD(P)-dependent dehydrogenase (short-subunit alcohol dehydrogenase family)